MNVATGFVKFVKSLVTRVFGGSERYYPVLIECSCGNRIAQPVILGTGTTTHIKCDCGQSIFVEDSAPVDLD